MSLPARKGWCPSLFEPMESGDGLIVRLKPRAATLDAAAARAIAEAAQRYGNGIVELTNRANVQLRGVRRETVAPIAALATRLRLAASDPAVERIRNITASPLGPDDPGAAFDSHALAVDLESMLDSEPQLAALPPKFGFLVDGGGALPLTDATSDIMLRPAAQDIAVALAGSELAAVCSPVEAVSAARRLALAFVALAAKAGARRMRELVQALGAEAVFAEAGLIATKLTPSAHAAPAPIGFIRLPSGSAFGIGLPFGQIEAPVLAALADLGERFGDGTLRMAPWRAALIVGVDPAAASELSRQASALGLVTDAGDPRRRIAACPGKPACSSATVDTRGDAGRLAARALPVAGLIHVSGCAKGCAHPGPAAVTLVGNAGRYDLVAGGRAADLPVARGLDLESALSLIAKMRTDAAT